MAKRASSILVYERGAVAKKDGMSRFQVKIRGPFLPSVRQKKLEISRDCPAKIIFMFLRLREFVAISQPWSSAVQPTGGEIGDAFTA